MERRALTSLGALRTRGLTLTTFAVAFAAACLPANASNSLTCQGLGAGAEHAVGVNTDGSVIVGFTDDGKFRAFRWTQQEGVSWLDNPDGAPTPEAAAMGTNAAGDVIVGWMRVAKDRQAAFRWTEAKGFENLGFLPGRNDRSPAYATGIDASGSRIVGHNFGAFLSTQAWGLTLLRGLDGKEDIGEATAISADGATIVGMSADGRGANQATAWIGAATRGLGFLSETTSPRQSNATAASADGTVIVGSSLNASGKLEAFRWSEKTGMQGLGYLYPDRKEESNAYGVSADGEVIVGDVSGRRGIEPFVWTPEEGMRSLTAIFGHMPTEEEDMAQAVSADGRVIVGGASVHGDGAMEAFRCVLARGGEKPP